VIEHTLAIIKPDAVSRGLAGKILACIEEQGFRVRALKLVQLSRQAAQEFYRVHAERPFYESLTMYMSSGPVVPMLLERDNAIQGLRDLMGATNPQQAATGPSAATTGRTSSVTPFMALMQLRPLVLKSPFSLTSSSGFESREHYERTHPPHPDMLGWRRSL